MVERCKHAAGWYAEKICLWVSPELKEADVRDYRVKNQKYAKCQRVRLRCNLSNHGCTAERIALIKIKFISAGKVRHIKAV